MSHFPVFTHEYIKFPPHLSSYTLSLYLPLPTGTNPQTGPVLPSCSPFFKKRHFCLFKLLVSRPSYYLRKKILLMVYSKQERAAQFK
jgi:hypothetical protein